MNAMCPVSFEKIDESVARINAALAVALLLLFLFSPWKWIILVVAADFCIRGFWQAKYSPFAAISKKILELLKAKPVLVDAAPKIFAARLGFFFSFFLTAAWLLNQNSLPWLSAPDVRRLPFLRGLQDVPVHLQNDLKPAEAGPPCPASPAPLPFPVDFSAGLRFNTAILLRTSTFIRKALP